RDTIDICPSSGLEHRRAVGPSKSSALCPAWHPLPLAHYGIMRLVFTFPPFFQETISSRIHQSGGVPFLDRQFRFGHTCQLHVHARSRWRRLTALCPRAAYIGCGLAIRPDRPSAVLRSPARSVCYWLAEG